MTEYNLGHVVGERGPKGDTGPQGPQGPKGDTGATGPQGPAGLKGEKGDTGPQGEKGPKGDTGTIIMDTILTTTSTNAVQNQAIARAVNSKADITHTHSISDVTTLQTVLDDKANTSHTHTTSEITDFPAIPDVSNYIQKSSITGFVKNDGSIDSNDYVTSQELPSKTSDLINDSSFTTLQAVYPVGSIYMSVNNVSPSVLFGFGVWEKIEDKFLLGSGTTYENGSTGGSADSVVVSHNHTQNSHTHKALSNRRFVVVGEGANWGYSGKIKIGTGENTTAYYYVHSTENTGGIIEHTETAEASPTINSTGESGTNKNMPPYLAVNIWMRIE